MEAVSPLYSQLIRLFPVASLIVTGLAGIAAGTAYKVLRHSLQTRRIRRFDALAFQIHKQWREIVRGDIPAENWRGDTMKREIVESIVIQEINAAVDKDRAGLQAFLRKSGLLDLAICKVDNARGGPLRGAMLALGAMRVPEAIRPLSEGLDDWQFDTRLAALHALGRTGLPEAAAPILEMLMVGSLKMPSDPVCNALVNCFLGNPKALIPYLERAKGESREVLARVASEIATPELADSMLEYATDPNPEVRACAAKAMGLASLAIAVPALANLVRDNTWFVRLRATIAVNQIHHPRTIPILLEAVRDSNRQVRIRAAAALAKFEHETIDILQNIVDSRDRYALHAMISALELGGGFEKVVAELSDPMLHDETSARLVNALREGAAGVWGTRPADPVVETVFP